ncbi:hypothetical protein Amet_3126 [Alkaliphilus metalliredigens QYMF]|uniref:Uncharacterized protein n=1 Tax=Alkaliphilus metalliredigens (strain QYMF) TaxID=293826 RepID=A6TSU7_ALKMQ|nr:DUF4349 domain-containing protein [Alkaliphilus metalliredigens]ABR49265.1 hypothetical protein Amet_3126 [Alkaliphilus metalliredigens QYMF]
MNCKDFHLYASGYIDETLTTEEKSNFELHLENCSQCNVVFENLKIVVESINEIEEIDLPENFTETFRDRLKEEKVPKVSRQLKLRTKNQKIIMGLAAALAVAVVSITALNQNPLSFQQKSTRSSEDMAYGAMDNRSSGNDINLTSGQENAIAPSDGIATESAQEEVMRDEVSDATDQQIGQRMRIQRGHLTIEVEKMEVVYEMVLAKVRATQGYVENTNTHYYSTGPRDEDMKQQTYMTLRIPSVTFDSVFEELKTMGAVKEQGFNEEDITDRYRNVEAEAENLQVQETQLRKLFEKAEKIEDLMRIENELARIRLQINQLRSQLKSYDQRVNFATIDLTLTEIDSQRINIQSIDEGLWSQMSNRLVRSTNQLIRFIEVTLVGLMGLLPPLLFISLIGGPVAMVLLKKRKNRNQ